MNVTLYTTGDYEKNDDFGLKKQTQFKPKTKPIQTQFQKSQKLPADEIQKFGNRLNALKRYIDFPALSQIRRQSH